MSCERHTPAIVDHACGAEIAADSQAHLHACAACRRMFDEELRLLRALDQQLELTMAIEPSAGFVPAVMARVDRPAIRWREAIWWSVPAAAAVLMLVTLGTLRPGERPATDRGDSADLAAPSAQLEVRTPSLAAPARSTSRNERRDGERAGLVESPRSGARARAVVDPPERLAAAIVVRTEQAQVIARYLALVRRGALDAAAIVSPDAAVVQVPSELVIAPLSVEGLSMTDVETGLGADASRRDPGTR